MLSLRSKITAKLLSFFFLNPHETLFVNEIAEKLSLDKRNLVKKLKELEAEGLLTCQKRGNLKLYSINPKYPFYKEYKTLLFKTVGVEKKIKDMLKGLDGIDKAFIYGSYASDKMGSHSDIDLLVVGRHNIILLQKGIVKLQKEVGREINVVSMQLDEFNRRKKHKDPFLLKIMKEAHIEVFHEI